MSVSSSGVLKKKKRDGCDDSHSTMGYYLYTRSHISWLLAVIMNAEHRFDGLSKLRPSLKAPVPG